MSKIDLDLSDCPRCGSSHEGLEFLSLSNPTKQFTHYGFCPHNSQPLIIGIRVEGNTLQFDIQDGLFGSLPDRVSVVIDRVIDAEFRPDDFLKLAKGINLQKRIQ